MAQSPPLPDAAAPNLGDSPTAGEAVRSVLAVRLGRFLDRTEELHAAPDPEAVHQLRVAARRLQAALRTFAPLLQLPATVRARPYRRVERRLGRLRDLDVLRHRLPDDVAEVMELRERLSRERLNSLDRVGALLRRHRLTEASRDLAAWLDAPAYSPLGGEPLVVSGPDLLAPALTRVLLHAGWGVPGVPEPTSPAAPPLHALRRRVKALRYALECLSEWLPDGVDRWLSELHGLQNALGTWHDEGLLLHLLGDGAELEPLRRAARERAAAAVAEWPAWRARYCSAQYRAALRSLALGAGRPGAGAAAAGPGLAPGS